MNEPTTSWEAYCLASRPAMHKLMLAVIACKAVVLDTYSSDIGGGGVLPPNPSRCVLQILVKVPDRFKGRFEEISGLKLHNRPVISC